MPKLIPVIESDLCRGAGTEDDHCRTVVQYHTPAGEYLAERDPHPVVLVTLAEFSRFQKEHERALAAIRWALGEEGEFPERDPKKPYGWRTELRRRAGI